MQKRQATVYDAVAGRVSSTGFLPRHPYASKNRDTLSSSAVAVPPEEALFRRRGAPERFAEDDIYWADRNLRDNQVLPDSDLLKAVHAYASEFYGRRGGAADFESLDETALIAIGVLLEEWAGDVLGAKGEGAFVEAEWEDERRGSEGFMGQGSGWNGRIISKRGTRGKRKMKSKELETEDEEEDEEFIPKKSKEKYKKPKIRHSKLDTESESETSNDQSQSDDEDIDTKSTHTDNTDDSDEDTESSNDDDDDDDDDNDKSSDSGIQEDYSTKDPKNPNPNPQPISHLSSSHSPSPSSSSASSSSSSEATCNHKSKRRKIGHSNK